MPISNVSLSPSTTFFPLFLSISLITLTSTQAYSSRAWINWAEDPKSAILTWQVQDESLARNQWVKYGYSSGVLTEVTDYATISQYATPPTSKFSSYTSSFIERATLTNLPLGGRVYYSFGSDTAGWSRENSFTAHPGIGPNTSISMVILGDTGFIEGDSYGMKVFEQIARPEFVSKINAGGMILGDLTYANGNQTIWDVFQDVFEPVSSTMSFQTNAGNHDEEAEAGIDVGGFLSFKTRFGGMPYWYPQNSDSGALFYSYNIGGLHMIALSAYNDLSALSPQTVFLKQDLAAIDRTVTPWVACVWHPPIYNSNTNHYKQHEAFRKAYEPLFLEYRVNMIFNGHVHAYQRTTLVADYQVIDPASGKGIYNFMIGMSGKHLYTTWKPIEPDHTWVAHRDATFYGYGVLTVHNASTACVDVYCAVGDKYTCAPDELKDHVCFENQLIVNPLPKPSSPSSTPSVTPTVTPTPTMTPTPSLTIGSSPSSTPSSTLSITSSVSPSKAGIVSGGDNSLGAFQSASLGYGVSIGMGSMLVLAIIGYLIFRSRKKSFKITKPISKTSAVGEPVVAVGFTGSKGVAV